MPLTDDSQAQAEGADSLVPICQRCHEVVSGQATLHDDATEERQLGGRE